MSRHINAAPQTTYRKMAPRLIHFDGMDGRKCLKCGSTTTYVTKKTGAKRWMRYKNGWQCYKCYLGKYMSDLYKNKKTIEFETVFEADKAAKLFRWERHHTYGNVRTTVSLYMIRKLKRAEIGFWVVDDK